MKLYEIATTAIGIVVLGIVLITALFRQDTHEDEQCFGVCIWCKGVHAECKPKSRTSDLDEET